MVFEKVREILAQQLEIEIKDVNIDSLIIDDLGATSLDIYDIVMSLEDEFKVEVPDEFIEKVKTVSDIVDFLEEKAN